MMKIIKKFDDHFEEYVCIGLFVLMTVLISVQIFSRFIFNIPLDWSEELARFVFVWLVYISISLAAKHNRHLKMEVGQKILSKVLGNKIYYLADLCWLCFSVYMIFNASQMVIQLMGSIQVSAVTRINMGLIYTIIPIGFTLTSIRIIQNMRKRALGYEIDNENIESVIIEDQLKNNSNTGTKNNGSIILPKGEI
ncbi:4-dicarboxylate transport system [Bacillus sp. OxB-1]|uniref:TRAP transporter small permease n=1 Tax=Bacillus sp. (strain OxB-1) TaxID=98228 RepID=UPI000581F08E|nr:TRAP transporter small permease [Bacillus sp. OxB-1]BAQ11629.1 4-dicarboxylate transport system [Bacillus sp. OxB-1]